MSVLQRAFFNFSVIKAPLPVVVDAFDTYPPMRVRSAACDFVLPPQPYQPVPEDPPLILWSPSNAPELTAFMPHGSGGDSYVTSYAGSTFRFDLASVRSTADDCVHDCLNEFAAHSQGEMLRLVRVMSDDPRWDFFEIGPALPFEDTEKYRQRLKRSRFRRSDVIACLEAWGAPVSSPLFWHTESAAMTFVPKSAAR